MLVSASKNAETVAEASTLLRHSAGHDGSVKTRINRQARKFGWGYRRTRAIWHKEARRVDVHELDALRTEARKAAERLYRLANAMETTDPAFFESDIAAARAQADRLRGNRQP